MGGGGVYWERMDGQPSTTSAAEERAQLGAGLRLAGWIMSMGAAMVFLFAFAGPRRFGWVGGAVLGAGVLGLVVSAIGTRIYKRARAVVEAQAKTQTQISKQ